jgi:hypothetical protein
MLGSLATFIFGIYENFHVLNFSVGTAEPGVGVISDLLPARAFLNMWKVTRPQPRAAAATEPIFHSLTQLRR